MRNQVHLVLSLCLCAAACGSDKSTAKTETANTTAAAPSKFATNASKMAQQATVSSQSQADQSEVATTGSDADASAPDSVMSKRKGGALEVHGWQQIAAMGNAVGDFDVTLNFEDYVGSNQVAANGNVDVHVRRGQDGSLDIALMGVLTETSTHGGDVHASFEPNFVVKKHGSRGEGRVNRALTGTVRRALKDALAAEADFDFFVNHTGTTVTDLYVSGTLSSRAISGTITVTDASSQDKGSLIFTDVVRANPSKCLCPESGSIGVSYTSGTTTEQFLVTFGATCGQVTLTSPVSAAIPAASMGSTVGAAATQTSGSSTASTAVSSSVSTTTPAVAAPQVITWDACIPG